jgi:hypothetical protein
MFSAVEPVGGTPTGATGTVALPISVRIVPAFRRFPRRTA